MGRLPLATIPDDPLLEELASTIEARGIAVPNLYLTIGNAPKMLKAWMGFTGPLRHDASSPRALRELVIMRVARMTNCAYMWAHHWPMATASGLTPAKLDGLAEWETSGLFDLTERTTLRHTDQVIGGEGVDDATFSEMREMFPAGEIVELTLAATFYLNLARFARALDIDIEPEFAKYAS